MTKFCVPAEILLPSFVNGQYMKGLKFLDPDQVFADQPSFPIHDLIFWNLTNGLITLTLIPIVSSHNG